MSTKGKLAALTVSAGLALAAPAHAASPGVNLVGNFGDPAQVQQALDTGAKEIRIFAAWQTFEPSKPSDFDPTLPVGQRENIATGFYNAVRQIKAAGRRVLVNINGAPGWANGGGDGSTPPTPAHDQDFANFVAKLLHYAATQGDTIDKVEVWNEPDEQMFWNAPVDAARYTALLKATYVAVKDPLKGSPQTQVYTGPTTGNDYAWLQQLYDNGAQPYFDAVAVHTDNACLVDMPDSIYRDPNGRLGRFTFLGVREVYATMTANGDGAKKIDMSEVGASSTGGSSTCTRGQFAGQKANGVTETQQADYLTKAFTCMANEPYIDSADWFQVSDTSASATDEMGHYGLLHMDGSKKPDWTRFHTLAASDGGSGGACGDLTAPTIHVVSPAPGQTFEDTLDLQASASDAGVGLGRISFFLDDNTDSIENVTTALANDKVVGLLPWSGTFNAGQGRQPIALGNHTIRVQAVDANGNVANVTIPVVKVAPGTLVSSALPTFSLSKKVRCSHRACSYHGSLKPPTSARSGTGAAPSIGGKVAVEWQFKNKKGKWRKLVGGLKPANKPFTFKAKLKNAGQWRVRVTYLGKAPYKKTVSGYVKFSLR